MAFKLLAFHFGLLYFEGTMYFFTLFSLLPLFLLLLLLFQRNETNNPLCFQRDHRIHTLDISGNDIGGLGVIYIAEMLAVNDTITDLVGETL